MLLRYSGLTRRPGVQQRRSAQRSQLALALWQTPRPGTSEPISPFALLDSDHARRCTDRRVLLLRVLAEIAATSQGSLFRPHNYEQASPPDPIYTSHFFCCEERGSLVRIVNEKSKRDGCSQTAPSPFFHTPLHFCLVPQRRFWHLVVLLGRDALLLVGALVDRGLVADVVLVHLADTWRRPDLVGDDPEGARDREP